MSRKIKEPLLNQNKDKFINFKKFKVYEVLYRFESLLKTLRYTTLLFFISSLVLAISLIFVLNSALDKSRLLDLEVKKTIQIINEKTLLDASGLAAITASTYFSMSYFNSESIISSILSVSCPNYADRSILPKLREFQQVILDAELIHVPLEVDRSKISIKKIVKNKKVMYALTVPVKVQVSRKDSQKYEVKQYTFGVLVKKSEPTLSNPRYLCLVDLGVL